jgi:hypothetical protein
MPRLGRGACSMWFSTMNLGSPGAVHRFQVLLGATLALAATPAAAVEPSVAFEVQGQCPALQELRRAFLPHIRVVSRPEPGTFVVRIAPAAGPTAALTLVDPRGATVLERSLGGGDCDALAWAFASIVDAYFVNTQLFLERPVELLPERPRMPAPIRHLRPPPSPAAVPFVLSLGLSGFLGATADPTTTSALGQVEAALGKRDRLFRLRLCAALLSPIITGTSPDRVEQRQSFIRLEAADRLRSGWGFVQPGVGVGVMIAHVKLPDVTGQPGKMQYLAGFGASMVSGINLAGPVWARAELSGNVFPFRELYLAAPAREIGHSPRASFAFTLGLELDLEL